MYIAFCPRYNDAVSDIHGTTHVLRGHTLQFVGTFYVSVDP